MLEEAALMTTEESENTLKNRLAKKGLVDLANNNNVAKMNDNNTLNKNISDVMDLTYETCPEDATVLQKFYHGSNIFITGATGFMGKVLIEKLLRSCPGVRRIYMVVRPKRGRGVEERIDDLTNSPCFDRLKQEFPKFKSKLRAVAGDIGQPKLGISEQDLELLSREIDIVFHVAATVRFDEAIKTAIQMNVRGTRELLNMCQSFSQLKSVIHVSTAYSNCPNKEINENFYESPLDCDKAIALGEICDDELLSSINEKLLGKWPNTYAYTKAISENVVKKYGKGLPVGVFRPAIVVCTNSEPMPGWIDNLYGPTGVIMGVSSGLMRTIRLNKESPANVVPCDLAINAIIASAWDVAEQNSSRTEIPIYNFVSSDKNPINWNDYIFTYFRYGMEYPISRAIWYYYMIVSSGWLQYMLLRFILHTLPAIFMDVGFIMTGHKPQMLRVYGKIHKFSAVIAYFGINEWAFTDHNVYELWDRLEANDKGLFPFDMRTLVWDNFIKDSIMGLRTYMAKDDPNTVEAAKSRMKKLFYLHKVTQVAALGLVLWLGWTVFKIFLPAFTGTSELLGAYTKIPLTTAAI